MAEIDSPEVYIEGNIKTKPANVHEVTAEFFGDSCLALLADGLSVLENSDVNSAFNFNFECEIHKDDEETISIAFLVKGEIV